MLEIPELIHAGGPHQWALRALMSEITCLGPALDCIDLALISRSSITALGLALAELFASFLASCCVHVLVPNHFGAGYHEGVLGIAVEERQNCLKQDEAGQNSSTMGSKRGETLGRKRRP